MRTIVLRNREEKEKYRIPRRVQDAIPVRTVHEYGIFELHKGRYSMTYSFQDINYVMASLEDQKGVFLDYSTLLNSLDANATAKLTIHNRRMRQADIHRDVLIPLASDSLDRYRDECNGIQRSKLRSANAYCQDKYLTITVSRKNLEEARAYFARVGAELGAHFARLGSRLEPLTAVSRLRMLQQVLREDSQMPMDLELAASRGHDIVDTICPNSMRIRMSYLTLDGKYGRVLYLRDYANYIRDTLVTELTATDRDVLLSIDILPVPMDEAIREVNKRTMGTEASIASWQRGQNSRQNYNAVLPIQMEQQREENREMMTDLTTRNQRMMLCTVTLVHFADSLEQLDHDTAAIRSVADSQMCQFSTLYFQQLEGLQTVLPFGRRKIQVLRTLTTESLAAFMPFRVQEILDQGGMYFGENKISRNLILINKAKLLNPNSFVLGVPGSGKSFSVKEQFVFLALSTKDDIIICDPEAEYGKIVEAMGGSVIRIASGGTDYINPLDMEEGYSDSNPISEKSELLMALFEQLDKISIGGKQRSIIDRCTTQVYEDAQRSGVTPTLISFRDKLLEQPEEAAKELALELELYTSGSLDTFAHPTNVDTANRIICYDILGLGEQLKTLGLLIITDSMLNRVASNWKKGVRTHLFIDEFHVVFENEHSAAFFSSAWRRFRKRNAYPTAITQNVDFLLDSVLARTMLSNSELVVMLNQSGYDQTRLAEVLHISENQLTYITNVAAGCGLIRYGSTLVPFENHFPKDTELYRLMSTKPEENL